MKRIYKALILFIFIMLMGAIVFGCSSDAVDNNDDNNNRVVFSLNYIAGQGGQIIGDAVQGVEMGCDGKSVTAVPNEGYRFIKWSDNNQIQPERQDTNIDGPINAIAIFEKNLYKVEYLSENGGYVDGERTQFVNYGDSTSQVTAVPYDGYKFVGWSDNVDLPAQRHDFVMWGFSVIAEFDFLFDSGSGTEKDPFKIKTYDQLLNIKFFPQLHYALSCDLDLMGIVHTPIFDDKMYFTGVFDGCGYAIMNLNVNSDFIDFPSLFGFIGSGGIIKNLNISNAIIRIHNDIMSSRPLCVGIVAGVSLGTLKNISVDGKIICDNIESAGVTIGGLVGQSQWIIENCTVNIDIEITDFIATFGVFYIGGMVGVTDGDVLNCETGGRIILAKNKLNEIDITDDIVVGGVVGCVFISTTTVPYVVISDSKSSVYINSEYDCTIGGLLGATSSLINPYFYMYIYNCMATGDINSSFGSAAGFVNNCYNGSNAIIKNCGASCDVINVNGSSFGFANRVNGSLSYCYAVGNVTGGDNAAGFVYNLTGSAYRSYSIGDVVSNHIATGFINMGAGNIIECFSNSDVTSKCLNLGGNAQVSALVLAWARGQIKNCYATGNITVNNKRSDISIAAVGITCSGTIINCYYSGKILLKETPADNSRLGTLTWGADNNQDIINCHWLHYDNSMIDYPFNFDRSIYNTAVTEAYEHQTLKSMCSQDFVDLLNANSESNVWVKADNCTPQLQFMTARKTVLTFI